MSSASDDAETGKGPKGYLEGFAEFSRFIASDDDLFLYRRFGSLAARNIVYLQAELQSLEDQLKELDEADRMLVERPGDQDEKSAVDGAARAWESFEYQAREGNKRQKKKMGVVLRIRMILKEYGSYDSH
jgi:hypothetical protein